MPRTITYAFSLLSPWAYLGHQAFHALCKQHGVTISYRPVNLGEVFPETGGLPLAKRHPARQAYRWAELKRWRELRGIPLTLAPKAFPLAIGLADRLVIALVEAGRDPAGFMLDVQRGIWAEERHMDDPVELSRCLVAHGHPDLIARAQSPEIGAAYEANRDWAIAAGVFGAPSYVLDGEVFWGQDRIDLLAHALKSGRAPYTADSTS